MTERLIEKLDRLGAEAGIPEMTPAIRRFALLVRQDVVAQPATEDSSAVAAPVQDAIPKIGCVNHDCDKCKAAAQPAPVQEPVNQRAHEMALRQWDHWKQYALELQERLVKYEGGAPMVLNTTPPAQSAPVQEPDELKHIGEQDCLLDVDEKAWRSLVENRGGCRCHISPPCSACSDPISEEEMNEVGYTYTTPPAQPALVQDAEGENKAVRCFLMLYGQAGLTVGQMKKHMAMSGFKSWPVWVETEHDGAHLTKAGAQIWIRHLFSLEAIPPAAQPALKPLTEQRIRGIALDVKKQQPAYYDQAFARAIEAAHGIKENK